MRPALAVPLVALALLVTPQSLADAPASPAGTPASTAGSVNEVVDTVVWRILDQIGLPSSHAYRWAEKNASAKRDRN